MRRQRALIIGGNGFIGSHLVDTLQLEGWRVTVYDRAPERYRATVPDVEYVFGELGNVGLLESVLDGTNVAFHLASTTIPQSSNEAPVFDIQSNLLDSVRFLELCVKARVARVVFLSSGGTVYGTPQSPSIREDHPTDPICSYGIVKLTVEKYLYLFNRLYGLPYVVLRPANPYGPRQNPFGLQGVIAVFLGCVAQRETIQLWGTGEVVRDFLHVSDVTRACVSAATSSVTAGTFNIGSGDGVSLNGLIAAIEAVTGRRVDVERMPSRPFDVERVVLDISHAREGLGWSPRVSLEDGLRETWEWVQKFHSTTPDDDFDRDTEEVTRDDDRGG